ncbi:E3 ubiquitin-protein ligase PPP1R11-like [Bufo bufo]|uniref:E3 ubiquitin-protein ligase PPP1R11-like n=1 Tax=Bufo bufo TaxID=8384 RepID=UPI001ABE2797|nr:E3 ubiquitin-protein ligase PPP1R11-like [Bufo bufo]XP_040269409.1 E3 ubiquitin-protein ligase PPP1R11-like [Bufo bufo]
MAESCRTAVAEGAASSTVTENEAQPEPRSLTIKLRKRKPDKKVEWTCDTVDNENLGRRSSKCESQQRRVFAGRPISLGVFEAFTTS